MQQISVRLGDAAGAWVEAQTAGGKPVRNVVEDAIRAAMGGGQRRPLLVQVTRHAGRRTLRQRLAARIRSARAEAAGAQRARIGSLKAVARLRQENGDLRAQVARLHGQLAEASRRVGAAESREQALLRRDGADRAAQAQAETERLEGFRRAVVPALAGVREALELVAERVGERESVVATAARDRQQAEDMTALHATGCGCYAAGRLDEIRHAPLPEAVRAYLVAQNPEHALLRREQQAAQAVVRAQALAARHRPRPLPHGAAR